jgi:CRP-like cAMP-binding protein
MPIPVTPIMPARLARTELLAGLREDALAEVAACGQARSFARAMRLFAQGAVADRCHAVLVGRIRIAQTDEAGGQLLVRFVGPGEMFGTVPLFTDRRYPAEAVALVDSVGISWSEPVLR